MPRAHFGAIVRGGKTRGSWCVITQAIVPSDSVWGLVLFGLVYLSLVEYSMRVHVPQLELPQLTRRRAFSNFVARCERITRRRTQRSLGSGRKHATKFTRHVLASAVYPSPTHSPSIGCSTLSGSGGGKAACAAWGRSVCRSPPNPL